PAPIPFIFRMDLQRLLENARGPVVNGNDFVIFKMNANVRSVQLVNHPHSLFKNPSAIGLNLRRDDIFALLIVHPLERALDLGEIDKRWLMCGGCHKGTTIKKWVMSVKEWCLTHQAF